MDGSEERVTPSGVDGGRSLLPGEVEIRRERASRRSMAASTRWTSFSSIIDRRKKLTTDNNNNNNKDKKKDGKDEGDRSIYLYGVQ